MVRISKERKANPSSRSRAFIVFVVLSLCCAGCDDQGGQTAIELTVTSEVDLDQIAVTVSDEGESFAESGPLPQTARTLSAEGETLIIVVGEERGGNTVDISVEGLRASEVVAVGQTDVEVVTGSVVFAQVHLMVPSVCGDGVLDDGEACDDGDTDNEDGCSHVCTEEEGFTCANVPGELSVCEPLCGDILCVEGQRCQDDICVCDTVSCPVGCCEGDTCKDGNSDDCCGSGGNSCETCEAGRRCHGGVCDGCDETSCPSGCCSGNSCHDRSVETCGVAGSPCEACDTLRADTCTASGSCGCGDGPICEAGQRCVMGRCACDGESCPLGCCSALGTCEIRTLETCGMSGDSCFACDTVLANRCSPEGLCRCGGESACAPGLHCVSGSCYCDDLSCADGCCADGSCRERSLESCGLEGRACVACDPLGANLCNEMGLCACGEGSPCGPGQRCLLGLCVCDDLSCPTGCCNGDICEESSMAACGVAGDICAACEPMTADICVDGQCMCGVGPECAAGQRCSGGVCLCDTTSCSGCCDGDTCLSGADNWACGSGGFPCFDCSPDTCEGGSCSGCNATTCADGCCIGAACNLASTATCGILGGSCVACSLDTADGCVSGECRCGASPACAAGQRCELGICVCDATSCPDGCCEGSTCYSPPSFESCGFGGEDCMACDAVMTDNCSPGGLCRCDGGDACPEGQRCLGGVCECDAASCSDGCCEGGICRTPVSQEYCGAMGEICFTCDPLTADGCSSSGSCTCGGDDACDSGQHCVDGECSCDGLSCAGCCQGNACRSGADDDRCGSGGSECQDCDPALCVDGICTGDCDADSCPDGCCSGSSCLTPSVDHCGESGDPCVSCDPVMSNGCIGGSCACGTSSPCAEGRHCVDDNCLCDSDSCPDGCCQSDTCRTPDFDDCGTDGEECFTCDVLRADNCADGECLCGTRTLCLEGQHCVAGSCICDSDSCSGCCKGGKCEPGDIDNECGKDGDTCQNCLGIDEVCVDQQCE